MFIAASVLVDDGARIAVNIRSAVVALAVTTIVAVMNMADVAQRA
jgi:hypothetical protein